MNRMITPLVCQRAFPFTQDVKRIISVCMDYDCWIDFDTAHRAWKDHSEAYAANWLTLPEDDDVLFKCILDMVDVEDSHEFVVWVKYWCARFRSLFVHWLGEFTRRLKEVAGK